LFKELAALPAAQRRSSAVRHRLIEMHLPLARFVARRFGERGEPNDDLFQVAAVGLIKSVDRFDPGYRVRFSTYAVPVMVGEVKRHFRDRCWAVRVTRQMQELRLSLRQATADLEQRLGRPPSPAQLAERLDLPEVEVLAGLQAANAYAATSLDVPASPDAQVPAPADWFGADDDALTAAEDRHALRPLLAALPVRERNVLLLRFFGNMTETQIAAEVGVSQMHVSRLLHRTLGELREGLLADG
jgi:RNA polymerase sigma-B factor